MSISKRAKELSTRLNLAGKSDVELDEMEIESALRHEIELCARIVDGCEARLLERAKSGDVTGKLLAALAGRIAVSIRELVTETAP